MSKTNKKSNAFSVQDGGLTDEPVSPEWLEWIALNLTNGVPVDEIVDKATQSGLHSEAMRTACDEIVNSPAFSVALNHAKTIQKWQHLADALSEMSAESSTWDDIPRLSGLNSEQFLEQFYAVNRPVIITDCVTQWPALRNWTVSNLRQRFGELDIQFQSGRKKGNFLSVFSENAITDRFSNFLDLISDESTGNDAYLTSKDQLLRRQGFSALLNDIILDQRFFNPVIDPEKMSVWIGPKGCHSPMHRDIRNVCLAQIIGRKSLILIPALQMHRTYNEESFYSDVDFNEFDLASYPLLKDATIYNIILEPGDMLFIPVGWWHFVKSLDVTVTLALTGFRFFNDPTRVF